MVCVPCCFIKLLFVFQAVLLPKKDIISLVLPGIFGAVHIEFRVKGVHTNDSGKYFNWKWFGKPYKSVISGEKYYKVQITYTIL